MRSALLFSALLSAASAANLGASTDVYNDFTSHQRDVLRLFTKIRQPELVPEHNEIMKTFKWGAIKEKFKDPNLLENFSYMWDSDAFLARNKDFSITNVMHFWQVKKMFMVLRSATDFDTFHKMAVWMRFHMNERMFAYALYSVLYHREDTQRMRVPPPYEVFPQYFVTGDVMKMAYDAHLRGLATKEDEPYVIAANYTGWMDARDKESVVSYFREDVGLASFWAFFNYKYASWMSSTESPNKIMKYRGQVFYVLMRNLLARYDMERYSRGLAPVKPVDLWEPVKEGYDPKIRHQSGDEFPARPEGLRPRSTYALSLEDLTDWEGRIRGGIAMSIYLDDKVQVKNLTEDNAMNMVGNMLSGGADSPNTKYYGSVFNGMFTIFGQMMDPHRKYGMAPSALEIPETMTRDPLFYRIMKRMWSVADRYKNTLLAYDRRDLVEPGVKIESMKCDNLITFFDDFDIHVDNTIDVQKIEDARKVHVIARQQRLNHQPFSYSLKMSSDRDVYLLVRLFLGPDEGWSDLWTGDNMRHHFYLLDSFRTMLTKGEHTLNRTSRLMFTVGEEPLGIHQMSRMAEAGQLAGKDWTWFDDFPHRLLLPLGLHNGLPVTLFAIATVSKDDLKEHRFSDGHDPFFPMDRRVFMWELKTVPNAHFQHLKIFLGSS